MKPLIISNWKMNFTLKEAIEYLSNISDEETNYDRIFASPSIYLSYLSKTFPNFIFAAQDVSIYNDFGAYTGETCSKMLASSGINYAIIGHSERRKYLKENNSIVRIKSQNCIQEHVTPIICIGESLETRKDATYKEFILNQAKKSIPMNAFDKNTSHENRNPTLIIAYEPLWSVGTGMVPHIDEIAEIISLLKNEFAIGDLEKKLAIVYGGSVSKDNLKNILKIDQLSGVLVGSASLDPDFFKNLNIE